ncbi:MAG: class I adenylate-forming enzyme family protein [Methyloligellaceae bacterium]
MTCKPDPEQARVSDFIFHYAAVEPHRIAMVHEKQRLTYAEVAVRVDAVASALLGSGVGKGDRIAMLCTPRPDFIIFFLAASSIGAIWVGLNPRYKLGEFRHVIKETQPKLVVARTEIEGRDYCAALTELAEEFGCIEAVVSLDRAVKDTVTRDMFLDRGQEVAAVTLADMRETVESDDTAVIIFTSGSTGAPKGAMLSHYGLVHGARVEHEHWHSERPVVLANFPINHIAGLGMTTLCGLVAGGTIVFQDQFDAGDCLRLIEKERITFWLQAPTMFHFVVNHPKFSDVDISSIEHVIWAGSPMAEDLVATLNARGARLATAFGMTELSTYVTYSDVDAEFEALANTIGRPEARYDLRVADADGTPVPVGVEGEIQARGRWLMKGYFGHEEATREAFTADGWFRTGDTAVAREDGNWRLVGRLKEMYKSGGYNIYPREIEIAIEAHPGVAMAAVLGVSDTVYQEVGHAFVQPEVGQSIDAETLRAWCAEHLANYKVPKQFTVMGELPRLPIGKLDKMSLRKSLGG